MAWCLIKYKESVGFTVSDSDYVASNDWMKVNSEVGWMWKEVVGAQFSCTVPEKSQGCCCSGQDSNLAPPEYKSELFPLEPARFVEAWDEVDLIDERRKLHYTEHHDSFLRDIIKQRTIMLEGLVGRMQETRNAYKILVGQFQNRLFVAHGHKWRIVLKCLTYNVSLSLLIAYLSLFA
jgi:hypothetical protein